MISEKINKIVSIWLKVFSKPLYVFLTLLISIFFYALNVFLTNINNFTIYRYLGFKGAIVFFFNLLIGFRSNIMTHSFVGLIITSIQIGFLTSLLVFKQSYFKTERFNRTTGIMGLLGGFIGVFAPGCLACGIGLASILGVSAGALSFLPYEGFEISLISIALLFVTIIYFSYNIEKCKIKRKITG